MARHRAADDFVFIRARLAELNRSVMRPCAAASMPTQPRSHIAVQHDPTQLSSPSTN